MTDQSKQQPNQELNQDQQYWLEQLGGEWVPTRFYPDHRLGEGRGGQMEELTFSLPQEVAQPLVKLAKGAAPALYLILLAGVNHLLATYSGQEDIVLGAPVFKQKTGGSRLVNHLLPLRTQVRRGEMSFKELLTAVKETLSGATRHQNYPLSRVIQQLPALTNQQQQRRGSTGQSFSMADVIVLLENIQDQEVLTDDEYLVRFAYRLEADSTITGTLTYDASLYQAETAQGWVTQLHRFFAQVGTNPNLPLAQLQLLSASEVTELLNQRTDADYPKCTIQQLFFTQVERYPERIALAGQGAEVTYGELGERVLGLAQSLRREGVQRETIVGIMARPSVEMLVGILAILTAGGGYLPIDPEYPEERIQYMLADSQAPYLLVSPELELASEFDYTGKIISLTAEEKVPYSSEALEQVNPGNEPADLAYIIYTSGSTGKPKGVMIEHKNVVRLLYNDGFQFDFSEEDVWTLFHSFCFDFSVWEMYGALLYGGKLVILPKETTRNPHQFRQVLIEHQVTVLNQTPTAFSNLIYEELQADTKELQVRYVIFGGEALKPAMLKGWQACYPKTKLINMYGITETTVHVTYKEIGLAEIETNVSNIGGPIPTLTCYILDENLQLLPMGAPGEICVGGAGVARGYLNRPELTQEKFVQNPHRPAERIYRSGDLGRLLPNGEMEYLGRIDRQVKIRGFRIELGEIESQLLRHPEIQDVTVLTLADPQGNLSLVAYLVAKVELGVGELREFLARELPEYMIPAYFVHLEGLPLTVNGKIDRLALPDPREQVGQGYVPPTGELEEELARIWAEVLGVEEVGRTNSFTELGGDSMKAVRLVVKINQALQKNLEIKDIYIHQTIAELAGCLESQEVSDRLDPLTQGQLLLDQQKASILADPNLRANLPASVVDFYPLSPIQQGMVFYSSIKPEEPIYHDQFLYPVHFPQFDLDLYVEGFRLLMQKHPILRTTFVMKELGEPMQLVHSELNPEITLDDLTHLAPEAQSQEIRTYLREDDLARKFSFNNDPLWRIKLFKVSATDYYIAFSFHHAILDGWSVANLIPEFMQVYQQLLAGEKVELTELTRSYRDYVGLGLARQQSPEVAKFWQGTLAGYSRNKLPFNIFSRKINDLPQSKINRKHLDQQLLRDLEKQAKAQNVSLKALFLSGYLYLLKMITTEDDIVTGVVTNDRPVLEDGDKILGCFLNSIPIRMHLTAEPLRKSELVHQVDAYLRDVKPYEIFLGEIADLIGEKNHLQNPIFDTLFNYIDFHVMEDVDTQLVQGSQQLLDVEASEMTNTLFDLEVSKTMGRLKVWIKYSPNYFADSEIETALQIYVGILEELAREGDGLLTTTNLLPEQMRQELIAEFNQTQRPYPTEKTLHQLFEEQVALNPEGVALCRADETMTYQELNQQANQVARLLQAQGVHSGDLVGLIAERNFQMVAGMLGILKAGAAYVPVDPAYPVARQEYILTNSGVSIALTNLPQIELPTTTVISLDHATLAEYGQDNLNLAKDARDLAYVIYTSGSTGRPKGVMIEHHSAVNLIQWVNREYQVGREDRLLFITSICFDLSVYDLFGILAAGGQVVMAETKQVQDPDELKRLMYEEQITFWDSVPTTMNHLINILDELEVEEKQLALRLVFLSGDWIPVSLPQRIRGYFPKAQVVSLGGATEGTIWSNYYPIPAHEGNRYQTSIPYGRPLDNNYFYILNQDQEPVPAGVAGELYIGGVGVARGYMNDPERTERSFLPNPFRTGLDERLYRTGDLGRMMPEGHMEFLGRIDNQVKIRGFRVELGEIENQLVKHPEVKEAVVVDQTDVSGNKYLCAYLVGDQELDFTQLKEFLAQQLPDYMVPSYYRQLVELPLNPNGKIDRKALPEPEGDLLTGVELVPPRDDVERRLAIIWSELLNRGEISIYDNFFSLGGHSLTATQLSLKIYKEFQVEIPLKVIFEAATLADLAEQIKGAEGVDYAGIEPATPAETYPVASAQQRLYVLSQMEGAKTSYNLPAALMITGELNIERLQESFRQLIQRHEALRTSFHFVEDQLVQKIQPAVEFTIQQGEISSEPDQIETLLQSLVQPFDLSQAPLFRVGLYQVREQKYLLFYDLHHIIADGISMAMVMEEFAKLYAGQELPELRIQYKDFAVWQNQLFASGKLAEQQAYWLQQFAGEIPLLNLPGDWPRPKVMDYQGATHIFKLDDLLLKRVDRLAAQTGTTRFMILMGVYTALLAKYSGQEDLVVGTPIAGRSHADLQSMMGVFINTLALRNRPKGQKSFLQYLAEVKENALQAYKHQDYPFEMLVDQLHLERDLSRNPLFDTMFALQNIQPAEQDLGQLQFRTVQSKNQMAKFDLTLNAYEGKQGINCHLEYRTSLFKPATIEQLAEHFVRLLQAVVAHPERKLGELQLLSKEERNQLLTEINPPITHRDTPNEIWTELFARTVLQRPDAVAVVAGQETLTYAELNRRSNQLAQTLRQQGVGRESIVGLMTSRSVHLLVSILAIIKAGGAYLPIDPEFPRERITYMLADSGAKFLLTEEKYLSQESLLSTDSFAGIILAVDEEQNYASEATDLPLINESHDLIYLIYTSGSTGKPKGTMIEHHSVCNFIRGMREQVDFAPKKRILSLTTLSFDIFVLESLLPLAVGMEIILATDAEQQDPGQIGKLLLSKEVDLVQLTPSRLHLLVESLGDDQKPLHSLTEVLVGGEAFPVNLLQKLQQMTDARIYNLYGPTEATVWATVQELTTADQVTIGRPLTNNQVYILDEYGQLCPEKVVGELYLAGTGLARGYWQRPELTAESFLTQPWLPDQRLYRTGDLARWQNGTLHFVGRKDQQLKIRGYRIEVGEVEAVLNQHPAVQESVVIGQTGVGGFTQLVGYYLAESEVAVTELREHLLTFLPGYMVPTHFVQLDELPLTPNGKVDRRNLPEVEVGQRPELGLAYQAPETETQELLAKLWKELLQVEQVGIHDSFFELGGNSILLVQAVNRLEQLFPGQLTVTDLFAYPTISKLTDFLEGSPSQGGGEPQLTPEEQAVEEAYWAQELAQPVTYLVLPQDYYLAGQVGVVSGEVNLTFDLPTSLVQGLGQVAHQEEVRVLDLLTALWVYTLSEITGQTDLVIEGTLPARHQLFPLRVRIDQIEDFSIFFRSIRDKYQHAEQMHLFPAGRELRTGLKPEQLIPLLTTEKGWGLDEHDLILQVEITQETITYLCKYNGNKLVKEKVQHLLNGYVRLMTMLVQEYLA